MIAKFVKWISASLVVATVHLNSALSMTCISVTKGADAGQRVQLQQHQLKSLGFKQVGNSDFYHYRNWLLQVQSNGTLSFFINTDFERVFSGLRVDKSKDHDVRLHLFSEKSVTSISHNSISTSSLPGAPDLNLQDRKNSLAAQADLHGLLEMENSHGHLFSTQSYGADLPQVLLLMEQNAVHPFKPVRLDPEFEGILHTAHLRVIRILSTSLRITDGAFELTLNSYGHISFSNRVLTLDLKNYIQERSRNGQTPLGVTYFDNANALHQRLLTNNRNSLVEVRSNGIAQTEIFRSNAVVPLESRMQYVRSHQSNLYQSEPSMHQAILGSFAHPAVAVDDQMRTDETYLNSENFNYKHIGKALLVLTRLAELLNEFTWQGVPLKVDKVQLRGSSVNSPFNDGTSSAALYVVTNKRTGEKFQFHGLHAGMIYQYGFAGTPGSDNRLEYADVIRVLELNNHR